jgi:uncharacterized protein (DUF1697 family)
VSRYVAFLRGINVGGHQTVKMADLRRHVEGLGFDDVTTYGASGNVRFETSARGDQRIRRRLQVALRSTLGLEAEVMLRSVPELERVVRLDPFGARPRSSGVPYVSFVSRPIRNPPRLPALSQNSDVEIILVRGADVFSWALPGHGHRYGYPNSFVERLFGQPATTRNWSTVTGVLQEPAGIS